VNEVPAPAPGRTINRAAAAGSLIAPKRRSRQLLTGLVAVLVLLVSGIWLLSGSSRSSDSRQLTLDLGDRVQLELVHIKAGSFLMGSPDSDELATSDEKPQHEVTISKDFLLGKYPVTQEQYQWIMGKNPSYFSAEGGGEAKVAGMDTRRFPVETVSWNEAKYFCAKASALTKRRVALPTEAEWEYACRAGTKTRYYCGEALTAMDANVGSNVVGRTTKVGEYPVNPWGLYDMSGNVWQWCADGRRNYTYDKRTDPEGPEESVRLLRGGSWDRSQQGAHAACRSRLTASYRNSFSGFRVLVRLD
jgi:formylglycine-generating enzyme required for sulfatase activity